MRRFLAILLLAMLPLQFSWAAVASYCDHESEGAGHFGHHEHQHHGDSGQHAMLAVDAQTPGDEAPNGMDLDCGHCHGQCSVMLTWAAKVPGVVSSAPLSASTDAAGSSQAATRPERPQWLPLA